MKNEEIVRALRNCASIDGTGCIRCNDTELIGDDLRPCCDVLKNVAADAIEKLTARCARYAEEIAVAQERTRWIPVEERLPNAEIDVLAVCNRNGYIFVVPAIYEDGKILTQDSKWNWCDIDSYGLYSEEADDYFVPEGWWENRQFNPDDVYNNLIDCAVTHWMPLPAGPEVE